MILHVISSLNPKDGGPPSGLKSLVPALNQLGYSNEVACLDSSKSMWLDDYKFKVHALGPSALKYRYSSNINSWLKDNLDNYSLIIIHGIWQYHSFATQYFCKKANKNYYIFCHGMLDPWFKSNHPLKHIKKYIYWQLFEKKVFLNAEALLYTSKKEGELAALTFPKLRYLNSKNVGYGISDLSENSKGLKKIFFQKYPYLQNKKIFLFAGRITKKKGLDLLIPAFINAFGDSENFALIIIGPDNENLLPGLMSSAINQCNIYYLGWVEEDIKYGAFASASIFVLPSYSENWGAVIAEALMFSLPVITTPNVNTYELIKEFDCGFISETDRVSLAKNLILWTQLSSDKQDALRKKARLCFENSFEVNSFARRLMKALNE